MQLALVLDLMKRQLFGMIAAVMRYKHWLAALTGSILITLKVTGTAWALGAGQAADASSGSANTLLSLALALLFPLGLTLVAWGALPPERAKGITALAPLGLALALLGYLTTGFAFQFGGAAFVSQNPELSNLTRIWSLVQGDASAGWGFLGLEGFVLSGDAATPSAVRLFVSQLPLVAAAVLVALIALPRRAGPIVRILTGLLVSAVTYPIAGHWIAGGGWLAHLGHNLTLGHGVVDFAGIGTTFVLCGTTALAGRLVFGQPESDQAEPVALPTAHQPLLANLGSLLAAVGWIALGLANPLYAEIQDLNWPLIALNGLAGLAGGTLLAQLYSWFATGRLDPLIGSRGALAGLVAAGVGAPFVPTWAALLIGALAGLALPLSLYLFDRLWRLEDVSAAVATYGLSALWGLVAVGLFADGRWGEGWNDFVGLPGQGVSAYLVAPGFEVDGGQLSAQLAGAGALILLGFLLPWGLLKLMAVLSNLLPRRGQADSSPILLNPSGEANPNPEA